MTQAKAFHEFLTELTHGEYALAFEESYNDFIDHQLLGYPAPPDENPYILACEPKAYRGWQHGLEEAQGYIESTKKNWGRPL